MIFNVYETKKKNIGKKIEFYLRLILFRSSVSETSVSPISIISRDSGNSKARRKLGRIMFSSSSRRRTATNQT